MPGLDFDTLTKSVSASAVGVLNALTRLTDGSYIVAMEISRGYAGLGWSLVLGSTAPGVSR